MCRSAWFQCDEIWGYVLKKEKHKTQEEAANPMIGDAYTFVGIEAKSKLILCYETRETRRRYSAEVHPKAARGDGRSLPAHDRRISAIRWSGRRNLRRGY
jgi:hypothetical protein